MYSYEFSHCITENIDNELYGIIYRCDSLLNIIIFENKVDSLNVLDVLINTRDLDYLEDFDFIETINDIDENEIEDTKNGLYYNDILLINSNYIEI